MLRKTHIIFLLCAAAGLSLATWAVFENEQSSEPSPAAIAEAIARSEQQICADRRSSLIEEHHRLRAAGENWKAAMHLNRCAMLTGDAQLQELQRSAELADRVATITSKTAPDSARVEAIENLEKLDPAQAAKYATLKATLNKKIQREIVATKRKSGVSIGMTPEDVLASSWGKPQKVNRSIYSHGVHEQWVYGGSNYLYFRDDKLHSIQTGN